MPHAEIAVVPGSHGGFNRIDELNEQITAFIRGQAVGRVSGSTDTATGSSAVAHRF